MLFSLSKSEKLSSCTVCNLTDQLCAQPTGTRHLVEDVLTKFIKPALQATFTGTNFMTVSVLSLRQWCSANCGQELRGTSTTLPQKQLFCGFGMEQPEAKAGSELDPGMGARLSVGIRARLGPRPELPKDTTVVLCISCIWHVLLTLCLVVFR